MFFDNWSKPSDPIVSRRYKQRNPIKTLYKFSEKTTIESIFGGG